jgi:UDP-3-O-[3-hydroxymyristoyl] glucosamine N-acyltransferase
MKIWELAKALGGKLQGDGDGELRGIAALAAAGPDDLAFADSAKGLELAAGSQAGCILVAEDSLVAGRTTIGVENPKLAFVRAASILCPQPKVKPAIHPTAVIAADANLGPDVAVGPYVVVESGAGVGEGTLLGAGVYLGGGVQVGSQCVLHPGVKVYAGARLGNRVILHSGVVIGSDGFGYVFAAGHYEKFPQRGQAVIEDDVEIGSNSTVDRGSLGVTVIGQGTKIDNLVQIAHNVRLGRHCVIAAQTGISGSCEIGDYVVMGGQVGLGDHVRVEDRAILGGGAGVLPGKIVRQGETVWGRPARRLAEFKKMYAELANLPALARKVKEISRHISKASRS